MRQDQRQRDEGNVADDQVETAGRQGVAEVGGPQRAAVDPFERGDRRVGAHLRVQLVVADIDPDDMAGAVLQQAVGEAAGRLADIETDLADRVDAGRRQRTGELVAAARHVMRPGVGRYGQRRCVGQFQCRLADDATGPGDAALADQPLRRRARRGQALGDEQGIRPRHPGRPLVGRLGCRTRLLLPRMEGVHAHRRVCAAAGLSSGSGRSCTGRPRRRRCIWPAPRLASSAVRSASSTAGGRPSRRGAWAACRRRPGSRRCA